MEVCSIGSPITPLVVFIFTLLFAFPASGVQSQTTAKKSPSVKSGSPSPPISTKKPPPPPKSSSATTASQSKLPSPPPSPPLSPPSLLFPPLPTSPRLFYRRLQHPRRSPRKPPPPPRKRPPPPRKTPRSPRKTPPPPRKPPPPPPPPPRKPPPPPPQMPPAGSMPQTEKSKSLKLGKKIGLLFAGIAVILQVVVAGFLVYKKKQLFKVRD